MSKFNKHLNILTLSFLILLVSACSSTANMGNNSTSSNSNQFGIEKKSFSSDHQLLLSLLNRPIPEDQQMMLRFASIQYGSENSYPEVSYISIRGDRSTDNTNNPIVFAYSDLIYKDQNSIAIGAPR
ncbi:MAG: hypothetical protein COB35_02985 [Gammaproteobacteria bacterium]|nr:MAG: hypothetical protein COB35_02985 [Gammaproteobacteria bacterium]